MTDGRVPVACAKDIRTLALGTYRASCEEPHSCVLTPQVTRLGPEQSLEMKSLLLSIVLLGLVAALQAQDPLSFPSEELNITGTWYTKAMVFNKTPVPEWKEPRNVFPMTVTALEDGTWEAKMTLLINGRCLEMKIMLQKTEEPGRYRASSVHGKKLVSVEELPEKDHYIFYCQDQGPGKAIHAAKLMGRSPEKNLEALEEFRKFTQRKGLKTENIVTPEQTETCVPEHD